MFVSALLNDDMTESAKLWNWFTQDICSDLSHWIKQQMNNISADMKNAHCNFRLHLITQNFVKYEWNLNEFYIFNSVLFWETHAMNSLITAEKNYNQTKQTVKLTEQFFLLNIEQQTVFDMIIQTVNINSKQTHFFVQELIETKKIFLWTALCCHYHAQNKIILCIVLFDIIMLLLSEDFTVHFQFKISLICTFISTCRIFIQFVFAILLYTVIMII